MVTHACHTSTWEVARVMGFTAIYWVQAILADGHLVLHGTWRKKKEYLPREKHWQYGRKCWCHIGFEKKNDFNEEELVLAWLKGTHDGEWDSERLILFTNALSRFSPDIYIRYQMSSPKRPAWSQSDFTYRHREDFHSLGDETQGLSHSPCKNKSLGWLPEQMLKKPDTLGSVHL